jgi:hypothetical protein
MVGWGLKWLEEGIWVDVHYESFLLDRIVSYQLVEAEVRSSLTQVCTLVTQ